MKRKVAGLVFFIFVMVVIIRCKRSYTPPAIAVNSNYLVVEGIINSGNDTTQIKLSRTVKIADSTNIKPELGAVITVESDQNASYLLTEQGKGNYICAPLNLNSSNKYRLNIKTTDGKQYVSDFTEVKITPPIDSITYQIGSNQLQINANTHDNSNNTRYYRWEYIETWQFTAKYYSGLVSNGRDIVNRTNDVYHCWGNDNSSVITLASSAKFSQDVISNAPIAYIPSTSEKIETRYSILLKQYALTKEAYAYWENLKKNTETLGSIFDAQPSELMGNLHCLTHPTEPVIGYISVCTVEQKRKFIDKTELPASWSAVYPYTCSQDTVKKPDYYNSFIALPYNYTPISLAVKTGVIVGIFGAPATCADCTLRGTNNKPSFWQ